MPQPQMRSQPTAKPFLAMIHSKLIDFQFVDYGFSDLVPKTAIIHALAEQLYDCGSLFYGKYLIRVGNAETNAPAPGITWLDHKPEQSGLGFTFGFCRDGARQYGPRRFSLVPPESVEAHALYAELTGKRQKISTLRLISDKPKIVQKMPPQPIVITNDMLAEAARKVKAKQAQLVSLEAEEAALLAELPDLEMQAAAVLDINAQVEEEVRRLLDPATKLV